MRSSNRGFTLVEILIAMVILLAGIVAVAELFSYSVATNISTRQMTTATLLTARKMEELRVTPLEQLLTGGNLDPDNPSAGFWEYVSVAADGSATVDTTTAMAPYIRLWHVTGTNPRTISIVVFSQRSSMGRERMELMRASTSVARRF